MRKEDRTGWAISIGVHAVFVLLLAIMATGQPEQQMPGYIEVEFGPLAEGRPVTPSRTVEQNEPEDTEVEEDIEEQPALSPPEELKPVDLPDQQLEIEDEDVVEEQEADIILPEEATSEEEVVDPDPQPERVVRPLGSGSLEADEGDNSGVDGTGNEEEKAAPFQIEGLNRKLTNSPLPKYAEQVNAFISIQVTVNPQGRVVGRIPRIKGSPRLESEVMNALLRWQFDPLPADAPQENQTGIISFRFQLR